MKSLHKHFHSPALGLFVIRFFAGIIFLYSGIIKLESMHMTIGFFASVGISAFWAYAVAIIEVVGGAAFIIGLFTRFFGLAFAVIMFVATVLTAKQMGLDMAGEPFVLFGVSLALMLSGCGRYSVCGYGHKDCAQCKGEKCACEHM